MKAFRTLVAGTVVALLLASEVVAQSYPRQPVRMIVPFSAGGITDHLARVTADQLSRLWRQSVVVENRPGLPGTASVAAAPPDGYTLMMTSNGHTIARAINKNVPFDPVADFAGVTPVAEVPFVMITPPSLPATTLKELVDLAKAQPGKLNFASSGVASSVFLAGETLRQAAGLDMVHLPFRGAPESVTAVMRGDVAFYFHGALEALELREAGKVRVLAITSAKRSDQLPDVPTVVEAGVPGFSYASWFGLIAHARTPREIIAKANADVVAMLERPDVVALLRKYGAMPLPMTPAEHDAMIKSDAERYTRLLRAAGVEPK